MLIAKKSLFLSLAIVCLTASNSAKAMKFIDESEANAKRTVEGYTIQIDPLGSRYIAKNFQGMVTSTGSRGGDGEITLPSGSDIMVISCPARNTIHHVAFAITGREKLCIDFRHIVVDRTDGTEQALTPLTARWTNGSVILSQNILTKLLQQKQLKLHESKASKQ